MNPPIGIDEIDALLPQTQCTRCGYRGCRPYAEAIIVAQAPINRCPPGGAAGIARLAAVLGREPLALDPDCGIEGPRRMARIESQACIGCTKCIQACPVDAIIGGSKRMHTILPALCTGCELCVPPCPTDCIRIDDAPDLPLWSDEHARAARERMLTRERRLVREQTDNDRRLAVKAASKLAEVDAAASAAAGSGTPEYQRAIARRRATIEAAMRRARERLAAPPEPDGAGN